jgi:hypothetical protein
MQRHNTIEETNRTMWTRKGRTSPIFRKGCLFVQNTSHVYLYATFLLPDMERLRPLLYSIKPSSTHRMTVVILARDTEHVFAFWVFARRCHGIEGKGFTIADCLYEHTSREK